MTQLRQQEERLGILNVRVKVVTFDANFMALDYVKKTALPWPLLLDPNQQLYQAYGMTRGDWWALYGFPSLWKYLKLIWQGHKPGRPGKDWSQLGGDILIDPQGLVRMHHVSKTPHDRPAIGSTLKIVTASAETL